MALWFGTKEQVNLAKNAKTLHCHVTENPKPKTKKFISISTRRLPESVEQGCPTFTDIRSTFTFFSLWRSTNLAKL